MKIGIYLSYIGLGANLLHLSYCHQIAKNYGPVTIITLCKNLEDALADDPLIEKVYYLNEYQKKFKDIFKLGKVLKEFNFDNLLIFYPSLRIYLSAKIAGIKDVRIYNIFKKKNLHLVYTAKKFTEKFLKIENCPTETNFYINKKNLLKRTYIKNDCFIIVIGAGSSGPTTRWGSKNFSNLINQLNLTGNFFFYILCGPNEKEIEREIVANLNDNNFETLSGKKIKELIPYLCSSDMYIGNDSFGSHITSQSGKKSIVILLDSPRAYTDYSKNYYRVIPKGFDINNLTHGSNANPNLVSVDEIVNIVKKFRN